MRVCILRKNGKIKVKQKYMSRKLKINVRERVEMVKKTEDGLLPSPAIPRIVSVKEIR